MPGLLTSRKACLAAGITYRQLDYWTRVNAVWPALAAEGSGSRRGWSTIDVERLRFINAGLMALDGDRAEWVAKVWAFLADEGLPASWLLVGREDGDWAVTVDDGIPARSGLLIVR
jgi:hypothetical protein